MRKIILTGLFVVAAFWQYDQNRVIEHAPGVLISTEPVQKNLSSAATISYKGYEIIPQAEFTLEARVLSREKYFIDASAELSPLDLALGWGKMSDTAVIDQLDIDQSVRFYTWRMNNARISMQEVIEQSSNMHMIPANDEIESQLGEIRKGSLVKLTGKLVKVRNSKGFIWNSSMSRKDTGAGACEVFYVTRVSRI